MAATYIRILGHRHYLVQDETSLKLWVFGNELEIDFHAPEPDYERSGRWYVVTNRRLNKEYHNNKTNSSLDDRGYFLGEYDHIIGTGVNQSTQWAPYRRICYVIE